MCFFVWRVVFTVAVWFCVGFLFTGPLCHRLSVSNLTQMAASNFNLELETVDLQLLSEQ